MLLTDCQTTGRSISCLGAEAIGRRVGSRQTVVMAKVYLLNHHLDESYSKVASTVRNRMI
jgi:hypothetical protein